MIELSDEVLVEGTCFPDFGRTVLEEGCLLTLQVQNLLKDAELDDFLFYLDQVGGRHIVLANLEQAVLQMAD